MPAAWSSDAPGWLYTPLDEPLGSIRFGASVPITNVLFATELGDLRPFAEYMQLFLVWEQGGTSTTVNVKLRVDVVGRDGKFGLVPHMLPNRMLHLRGDAGVSFYPSTQNANQWWDQSGNLRHATNTSGVSTQMPSLVDNALNQKRGLSFDGGDILSTPAFAMSTFTIFSVFAATTAGLVYEQSPNINTVNNDGVTLVPSIGATMGVRRGSLIDLKDVTPNGTNWAADGTYRIIRQEFGGTDASFQIYQNGSQRGMTVGGVDPGSTLSNAQSLFIGARSGISAPLTGTLMELLVYSPALNSADALRLEREYFGPRYGIAVP